MTGGREPASGVDYPAFVAGLRQSLEPVGPGGSALAAMTDLVAVARDAVGAMAGSFIRYGVGGGRLLVATAPIEWAIGRPIDQDHPKVIALLADRHRVAVIARDFPDQHVPHLLASGVRRALVARADFDGRAIGSLQLYFPEEEGPIDDAQFAIADTAAAVAGVLCAAAEVGANAAGEARPDELLVAITSHELRTPVTVVKGYADTLVDRWEQLDDTQRREAAQIIGQRAGELAQLLDGLLLDSVLTGESGGPVRTPFDLAEVLVEALDRLPERIRDRLDRSIPSDLPLALGDPIGVAAVVAELAGNADKYAPDTSEILITAGSDDRTVYFRIADHGVGVRPANVERAFDRFWQAEGRDRRRFGGLGLGLYLVRRLVERQNGWVSLRPREAGGTVAEVRLPRASQPAGEA